MTANLNALDKKLRRSRENLGSADQSSDRQINSADGIAASSDLYPEERMQKREKEITRVYNTDLKPVEKVPSTYNIKDKKFTEPRPGPEQQRAVADHRQVAER